VKNPFINLLSLFCLAAMLLPVTAKAANRLDANVAGDVRVQFLSETLVRLELRGSHGFEDRNTFTVVKRPRALADSRETSSGMAIFAHGDVRVEVPNSHSLKGITIKAGRKALYVCDGTTPPTDFFPGPASMPPAIAIADNPRIVPPKWGASAPPDNSRIRKRTSGWDVGNQALDIYVFLPKSYEQFRKEFLSLTGPTEMPPLYNFGLWHSRYHPYTEQEALDVIDHYHNDEIPIDNFVVDTDWRVGASDGYAVNTKLFPDMKRFIDEAHNRHVRLMYNDHPEPVAQSALDPKEMTFRHDGLASLLKIGADVWWYDRNWSTQLHEPAPGLPKEVWGAAIFHDITQEVNPNKRPLIMSNVPGIDNGQRHYAPHPAAHRYPVWWTGDTHSNFDFLRSGVANAVDGGVESLIPYMSEDLGGHFGNPTPEVYARFIEYGALSPMMRLHCTVGETRDPWAFGDEVEGIVREYAKLRYRLLPMIYSAARRNYEDGTPLLRRLDLEWPTYEEASRNDQYMLGDDILVAPIVTSKDVAPTIIPRELFKTPNGSKGLQGDYFDNKSLAGKPKLTRVDPRVDFDWGDAAADTSLPVDNFSVLWTGKIGPMPVSGKYDFATITDDGVRLFIDGKAVIDAFRDMDHQQNKGSIELEAGKSYNIRMEYFDSGGEAAAHLMWIRPDALRPTDATRTVWIPPGQWVDQWSEHVVKGPALIDVQAPLEMTPMWMRAGSIAFLAPEMSYAEEHRWDPITIDAYVPEVSGTSIRTLYEDDGASNDYKDGRYSKTEVTLTRKGDEVQVKIRPPRGKAYSAALKERGWKIRLHFQHLIGKCTAVEDGQTTDCDIPDAPVVLHDIGEIPIIPFTNSGDRFTTTVINYDLAQKPTSEKRSIVFRFVQKT
jgi:alpha-glucosidase (family GH31 glycosyl hydrolase)